MYPTKCHLPEGWHLPDKAETRPCIAADRGSVIDDYIFPIDTRFALNTVANLNCIVLRSPLGRMYPVRSHINGAVLHSKCSSQPPKLQ